MHYNEQIYAKIPMYCDFKKLTINCVLFKDVINIG